jgi:ABC-2 type transport system permease protein
MLLTNEWRYLIRQPLLWLACIILPLVAYLFAVGIGGIDTIADKRLQALHMTLLMMCLPLLVGALAPLILLRDHTNDMLELILVTPQSAFRRLFARVSMLFLLCASLMLTCFIIMWFMLSQTFGFQWSLLVLSLWDVLLLALPACAFFSALAFCLHQRFSSAVIIYAIFCSLWLAYLVVASMTGSPMLAGSSIVYPWLFEVMRCIDPFGNTPLIAHYQNTELKLYGDGIFYVNRLAYCLMAVGLFYFSLKLRPYKAGQRQPLGEISGQKSTNSVYSTITPTPKASKQLLQLSLLALSTLLKQRLSQFLLLGWTFLMFNEVLSGINYVEPLSVLTPTSLDALNRISDDVLPLMGCLFALLWSWQLCWRNRQTGMAELIGATPVRSAILMLSHFVALSALIVILMLLSAVASLVAEGVANSQLQLLQYPIQLGMVGLSLIVLGAIFIAIHTVSRSPMLAVAGCIGILLMKYTPLSGALGLTHTLWKIAASPIQQADAFWGFEQSLSVYWPFMCFWLLVAFTLLWLAAQCSHRTTSFINYSYREIGLGSGILLVLTIFIGFNLHNDIIDERPLMNSDLREQWRADYENQYAAWAAIPQPVISHVDSKVDIYPQTGEADFTLNYTLLNRSNQAIDRLLIGNDSATALDELRFSIDYQSEYNPTLGQTVVTLSKALIPGEQMTMWSRLTFVQPQLWPAVMHQLVKPSFSYLRGVSLLPTVGFQPQYQLRNELLRQEYSLPPRNLAKPSNLFADPQSVSGSYDWASMHSIVSTSADQVPLAQGLLIKEWQQNGRNYAEYQTDGPIRHASVWFSVATHVIKRQVGSTLLEVFSPEDSDATQVNMQAMEDTLVWMTSHVAPYQGERLSLITLPDIGPTGYALPQMIMISHRVGFRAQPAPKAGFDQRYRRAVHETAHQWFGHDLGNGIITDSAFLVESMAKYVELVLIEQHHGIDAMQALVDYERQRYKVDVMRSTEQVKALVDATENYDMYSRATLVFAILRDQLGDEVICQALRLLWQQHAYPNPPATSMDFVRALKSQVNVKQQVLVDELLLGTDIEALL